MRKLFLMIILAIICGIMFTSCNNEKEVKNSGELYAIGVKSVTSENSDEENTELVFNGSDIKFYNITTGEIVFVGLTANEVMPKFGLYSKITLFLDENPLFETVVTSTISSIPFSDIVFVVDIEESKIFLQNGYPKSDLLLDDEKWEAFIKYLRDNGKLKE